jgi:RimJ/RimL family protein N-acetyltransferase/ribosomal protein S18 acetylase RimI-like enzyme
VPRTHAARIRAFSRAVDDAAAERAERFAWGTLVASPSLRDVYDANFLRLERSRRGGRSLAGLADELQADLFHRKVVADRSGARLEPDFRELGWTATTHLVMALRRAPDRRVDTSMIRERSLDDLARIRRETSLRDHNDPGLADRLLEAKRRVAQATRMRNFVALAGRRIAAYCELRSDGRVAQIEDVNTLEEFRGRGLGRALVQHVADEAVRDHEIVFLEALARDWPRKLYAKLGFDVVDERHLFLRLPHPLTGLRVNTPRLELRLATNAELHELAQVARSGIHPPEEMPFATAWTDSAAAPRFVEDVVAFHEGLLAAWRRNSWTLNLVAFHDGRPIGSQGATGRSFARTRRVDTGSWLGSAWQRRGLGTEMRAAILELAFRGLGAREAWSGALDGNEASRRVSDKLGYVVAGDEWHRPRGERVHGVSLVRRRRGWSSPVPVEITGLAPLRHLFGLDD